MNVKSVGNINALIGAWTLPPGEVLMTRPRYSMQAEGVADPVRVLHWTLTMVAFANVPEWQRLREKIIARGNPGPPPDSDYHSPDADALHCIGRYLADVGGLWREVRDVTGRSDAQVLALFSTTLNLIPLRRLERELLDAESEQPPA